MKTLITVTMFAAVVALAAPSEAQAKPFTKTRHGSMSARAYAKMIKRERKLQKKIVRLTQSKTHLQAINKRLRRQARRARALGHHRQALRIRRALRANHIQLQRLARKIQALQRQLVLQRQRLRSRVTVQNLKRRPVVVEVRMGFSSRCALNPLVARKTLRRGQQVTVSKRGRVVCYRQLKLRPHTRRKGLSRWIQRTLPRPGQYRFVLKNRRFKGARAGLR